PAMVLDGLGAPPSPALPGSGHDDRAPAADRASPARRGPQLRLDHLLGGSGPDRVIDPAPRVRSRLRVRLRCPELPVLPGLGLLRARAAEVPSLRGVPL